MDEMRVRMVLWSCGDADRAAEVSVRFLNVFVGDVV